MGTEREVDALASDAIASSEKEFFAEAMGQDEPVADESGDRSLETMGSGLEGQHESGDDEGEGETGEGGEEHEPEARAEGEGKDANAERDEAGRFKTQPGKSETPAERGLRTELVGERDKRKAAETELTNYRAEMDRRFAALEARLAQPSPQQQPQTPKAEPSKEEIPDRWLDPDGYDRYRQDQILTQVRQERVAGSFQEARAEHGAAFDEAYKAADVLPVDVAKPLLDSIMRSPNPARTLMTWHKQQQAMRDIGNDPVAFRDRVAAEARESLMKDPEFRKQVLGGLQAEARGGNDGSPRPVTKLPPSLNSARGGGMGRADASGDTSDSGLFADAWR